MENINDKIIKVNPNLHVVRRTTTDRNSGPHLMGHGVNHLMIDVLSLIPS